MINPGTYNITAWQGADYDKTFTVTQNGTALNWTGYSARMQVRDSSDATATLLSLTNGSGIIVTDSTTAEPELNEPPKSC